MHPALKGIRVSRVGEAGNAQRVNGLPACMLCGPDLPGPALCYALVS